MYLDDRQADWLCSLLWEDWNLQAMSAGKFKTSVQEAIWMVCCYCCCCSWWWWMRYHLSVVCGVGLRWLRSPLWDQRELDSCHSRGSKWAWSWIALAIQGGLCRVLKDVFIPEVWLVFCWDASLCEKWGQLEGRSTIFKTGIFDLFFWANFSRTLLIFIFPTRPSHWYLPHVFCNKYVMFAIFYLWKNIRSSTFFGFFERDHLNQEQAKVERDMQLAQQDSGGVSFLTWRWKIPEFSRVFFMGTYHLLSIELEVIKSWKKSCISMYFLQNVLFSAMKRLILRVFVVWYDNIYIYI